MSQQFAVISMPTLVALLTVFHELVQMHRARNEQAGGNNDTAVCQRAVLFSEVAHDTVCDVFGFRWWRRAPRSSAGWRSASPRLRRGVARMQ